jgi:hypothetical protein
LNALSFRRQAAMAGAFHLGCSYALFLIKTPGLTVRTLAGGAATRIIKFMRFLALAFPFHKAKMVKA